VLLSHAPPRGIGDGDDPPHRGFTALHGLVAALRPAALLHGHVHPVRAYGAQAGSGWIGHTVVCNVTGWHLLDIVPGSGAAELLHSARHQGRRGAR
jgi:Icc-related predicted phosphoesterase